MWFGVPGALPVLLETCRQGSNVGTPIHGDFLSRYPGAG
jgi:hypothetical protein